VTKSITRAEGKPIRKTTPRPRREDGEKKNEPENHRAGEKIARYVKRNIGTDPAKWNQKGEG